MLSNPRTLLRIGRVLSSWLLFGLVCGAGAFAGSHLQASAGAFDAAAGGRFDYPYDHYLQILLGTPDGRLHRVEFAERAAFAARHHAQPAPLQAGLPVQLHTPRRSASLSYTVHGATGAQLVETRYADEEWTIVSRYRVDGATVTPLYCRAWSTWLVVTGLLYFGLPLAVCVWLCGRFLRRREERVLLARGERPYLQHRYRLS